MMRIPLAGSFELLPMCNLSCKMCYVRKSRQEVDKMGGLLPAEWWLKKAQEARDLGLLFPLLTGGEPFLRQDIQQIIEGMEKLGLQISINSNGTLIDEQMAYWLSNHRPTRINITLYGASADSYQRLCGDGSAFLRVQKAISLLRHYQIPVKFNMSVTPYNVHELKQVIELAHSFDSPIDVAAYMFPPVRRDAHLIGVNDRLSADEAGKAKVLADFYQRDPAWFKGQTQRYASFVEVTDEMLAKQAVQDPHEMNCRAGRCSFWIDWQGYISNCGMYHSAKTSLKDKTLSEGWQYVVQETNQIRYSSVCTNCPNYHLCHACISMVYSECGDLNGRPTYLCEMNAAAARYYAEYAKKLPVQLDDTVDIDTLDLRECDIDEF